MLDAAQARLLERRIVTRTIVAGLTRDDRRLFV